jgi:hypothetical protein
MTSEEFHRVCAWVLEIQTVYSDGYTPRENWMHKPHPTHPNQTSRPFDHHHLTGRSAQMKAINDLRSRAIARAPAVLLVGLCLSILCAGLAPTPAAWAAVSAPTPAPAAGAGGAGAATGSSLEAAASRAGNTGRKVAMSLIGLAFAVAGIVLAFRRDFKEAAGVFAVGIVAVLLATPAGISLLQDTVNSLFGSS